MESNWNMDFDKELYLTPVSEESPSGENLEYDPDFTELESAIAGKEEHVMGDEVIEAEEADWKLIEKKCAALMKRTRDLRIYIYMTTAWTKNYGLEGLVNGLEIIKTLFTDFWDSFYPQLDPDDDNDPMERMNIFSWLSPDKGAFDDQLKLPQKIRDTVICSSKVIGSASIKDLLVIAGEYDLPDNADSPDAGLVASLFLDVGADAVLPQLEAITSASRLFKEIDSKVTELVGASNSPNMDVMLNLLQQTQRILETRYNELKGEDIDEVEGDVELVGDSNSYEAASNAKQGLSGEIRNRKEVRKAISKIIRYFETNEPNSPIPFFMKRCDKLLDMDFYEIIAELAPDSYERITTIAGAKEEENNF